MNLNGIEPLKENLESHPIFSKLNSLNELKVFMEHHVFAVWDFMSLLKKLQQMYVPHGSPWIPNSNGNIVRFINEIVMEEESDQSFSSNVQKYFNANFKKNIFIIYLFLRTKFELNTKHNIFLGYS